MTPETLTALIGGITALVTAVTGLVVLIVHIKNHQPIDTGNAAKPAAKPGIISPTKRRWDYQ